jgi:hypothetical protein
MDFQPDDDFPFAGGALDASSPLLRSRAISIEQYVHETTTKGKRYHSPTKNRDVNPLVTKINNAIGAILTISLNLVLL